MSPPSLLDRVDLTAVRALAMRLQAPFAGVLASLLAADVLQHDPDDPHWPDRDRLILGDADAARQAEGALAALGFPPGTGAVTAPAGAAVALGYGAAAVSHRHGGIFRVWCVLGPGAAGDGALWEVAVAGSPELLTVVVVAPTDELRDLAALFGAAGWRTAPTGGQDPVEILAAFDHALLPGAAGAVLVEA